MIQFLNPSWLWALWGITIPIAIHLLSQKEGKVISIGSLRHLEETPSKKFRGLKLNEYILLLIRCLLIGVLVLWLAGISFYDQKAIEKKWLLIEPNLQTDQPIQKLIDSLINDGYELRSFEKSFPVENAVNTSSDIDNYTLVEDLRTEQIKEGIVISHNQYKKFAGQAIPLPDHIRWITLTQKPFDFLVNAQLMNKDSVSVIYGHTEADYTSFERKILAGRAYNDTAKVNPRKIIKISLLADADFLFDAQIIEASLNVVESTYGIDISLNSNTSLAEAGKADWVIWLKYAQPPSLSSQLLYYHPKHTNNIIEPDRSNRWRLTSRLNTEVAIDTHLPALLASILLNNKTETERVSQLDRRMMADSLAWPRSSKENTNNMLVNAHSPSADYLLLVFAALLMLERTLSYLRQQ